MQKYVIVQFLEDVPVGVEFNMSYWPLHVTLVANFAVNLPQNKIIEHFNHIVAQQKVCESIAAEDDYFGPEKQVHVMVLEPTNQLMDMHLNLVEYLKNLDAVFDEPKYLESGYRAHATIQKTQKLQLGDKVTINELSLVDMFPDQNIKNRKVLSNARLIA